MTNEKQELEIELPKDKIFHTIVTVMRANPPHLNHTLMLKELCDKAVEVKLNLGSSNIFNERNPFKIEEREEMINIALDGYKNIHIYRLPDFGDADKWYQYLYKINEPFTDILSGNPYDIQIYKRHQEKDDFDIIHPKNIVDKDNVIYTDGIWKNRLFLKAKKPLYVSGTFVRSAIVNNWEWENFVEEKVTDYIKKNDLIKRVKKCCSGLEGITLQKLGEDRR